MAGPLFAIGGVAYVRESAALGFLEAVSPATVTMAVAGGEWTYTVRLHGSAPPPVFGDRVSFPQPGTLYYTESELMSECDAMALVEEVLLDKLNDTIAKRDQRCL